MLFHSPTFLVFFVVVALLFSVTRGRARRLMLLAASYVFYGSWNYRYTLLIAVSTLIDYVAAARIRESRGPVGRRAWLIVSLVANLGILAAFKYAGFFAEAASRLTGLEIASPGFLLPVGISFYTFQSMSYTIDVYRGRIETSKSLLDFSLYVSFFPQLVAGPIVRAAEFLPQLTDSQANPSVEQLRDGARRFVIGFVKKVLIADNLAILVDRVHGAPELVSSGDLWVCAYAFAFQIYFDFSGYSDMAIGLARMMGYDFPENFLLPYTARNVSDFWRRWHVTLSSWLRDYLYVSLGGNRGSRFRTLSNLLVTMLLGGLWHGANWTFVLWGALHGLFLVVHRLFRSAVEGRDRWRRAAASPLMTPFGVLLTFHCWVVSMVVFRAANLDVAMGILRRMVSEAPWTSITEWGFLLACAAMLAAQQLERSRRVLARFDEWPFLLRVATIVAAVVAVVLFRPVDIAPFLYFQF